VIDPSNYILLLMDSGISKPTTTLRCIQWHGEHKTLSPCLMAQLDPKAL